MKNGNRKLSISCLLVNTVQGEVLLDNVKEKFDLYPTKMEWIEERNKNLIRPTPRPEVRETIYKDIEKYGYTRWAKRYYFSWDYLKKLPIISVLTSIIRKVYKK